MTDTLVDTNVFIDVANLDPRWMPWSRGRLAEAMDRGSVVLNQVVYAELAIGFEQRETVNELLRPWGVRAEAVPWDAAFIAGRAYLTYRRRGGSRRSPLPDFLIGAHAAVRGYRLLTRDRGYYREYFPTLDIVSPDVSA